MKYDSISRRVVSLMATSIGVSISLIVFSSPAGAQRKDVSGKRASDRIGLSIEQQGAVDLLKTQAQDLKLEADKPAASALQARIADVLWPFDQPFASELFVRAFEAARQPVPDEIPKAKRAAFIARQAANIREVLARLGKHDSERAATWIKKLQEETPSAERSADSSHTRCELLLEIALQLASTNPEQSQRLGLASLSSSQIPEGFGRLLFSLANIDRRLSDELFRAGVATLRRNQFPYDSALLVFTNYIFGSGGQLHGDATPADAELLANYFVDAAWHQGGGAGVTLPEASAQFFSFLQVRGIPIVARHRPDRLPELEGRSRHLAAGLTPEQAQRTTALSSLQDQQRTIADRNRYDIDEQIQRAERQKDLQVRDSLFNSIAHSLMRQDSERALKVAARIDDEEVRRTAQDDINLVRVQAFLASKAYEEARQTSLKFSNPALQARVLVQLAGKALAENKDTGRAAQLLGEASDITLKSETSPDKAMALLLIAQQFAKFDAIRGFDTLNNAIKTVNRLNDYEPAPKSVLTKPRLLTIKTFTVINGNEMSANEHVTMDAIDFSQIGPFVAQDYMQTRLLGDNLQNRLLRAKYLTAVAGSVLSQPQKRDAVGDAPTPKLPANEAALPAPTMSADRAHKQQLRSPQ